MFAKLPNIGTVFWATVHSNTILLPVLDPQISYKGMKADYADNSILSDHLKQSRSDFINYFNANYSNTIPVPSSLPLMLPAYVRSADSAPMAYSSPQKLFMAQYHRKKKASINELEEYFKLPAKDFDACNSIHWWVRRRAQFPNLFCMAHDILCISGEFSVLYRSHFQHIYSIGSAVTVERIFSDGHNSISLWHASLHADTIHIFMLVKKWLHLACAQANAFLYYWAAKVHYL